MFKTLKALKHIRRFWKAEPRIVLSLFGEFTEHPKVCIGVHGKPGIMTVFTFDDDDAGNAQADLASNTLSHITGIPVLDVRAEQRWEAMGPH